MSTPIEFTGEQELVYKNNSPDTLTKVFYHLYYNAFQPGSMMDARSRTIQDPDPRVKDRIFHLNEDEQGYQKVNSLTQNGKAVKYVMEGTILEVTLDKPILPGKTCNSSIWPLKHRFQNKLEEQEEIITKGFVIQ